MDSSSLLYSSLFLFDFYGVTAVNKVKVKTKKMKDEKWWNLLSSLVLGRRKGPEANSRGKKTRESRSRSLLVAVTYYVYQDLNNFQLVCNTLTLKPFWIGV
jgi:hypothetical protein